MLPAYSEANNASRPLSLLATENLLRLTGRLARELARADRLEEALRAIADNAEAWHGDDAAKGRALVVIAKTARAALAGGEATEEGET